MRELINSNIDLAKDLETIIYHNIKLSSTLFEKVKELYDESRIPVEADELEYFAERIEKLTTLYKNSGNEEIYADKEFSKDDYLMAINNHLYEDIINPLYSYSSEIELDPISKELGLTYYEKSFINAAKNSGEKVKNEPVYDFSQIEVK